MNLKRERSDSNKTHHANKRLRIRIPIIPKIKKEQLPFVAFSDPPFEQDDDEYIWNQKDEDWTGEDEHLFISHHKSKAKKHRARGVKKETQFRNIFWGKQQSAWMGSIRVKGTIVRSCSRKSDVLAAKILNTRCRRKGITPPNPEVGFLSRKELSLRSHAQTRRSRGKKKGVTVTGALGKRNRNLRKKARKKSAATKRSNAPSRSSPFKNIFWGTQQKAWMGNIRVKGTIVRSCSRKSDVQAAKILNSRCREKNIEPPNPEIGFIDSSLESKYLSSSKNQIRKTERPNEPPVSGQYVVSDRSKDMQAFNPLEYPIKTVKIEEDFKIKPKTDATCSKYKVKVEPEDSYNNVFWSKYEQAWIGCYETPSGRVLTVKSQENALTAAKMLNSACRDACVSNPNPFAGYLTNDELFPSSDIYVKAETPTMDDSFNYDFQDLFKPINYDFSTSRTHLSLETVELPPPVLDEEDFKAMNEIMFKYISDLLPEPTPKYHRSPKSSLFDDIPLPFLL